MKNACSFLILIFTSTLGFSQEPLKWEEVIHVDSTVDKSELFNRARQWYSNTFNSEKDVISISDREAGEISGNAVIEYNNTKMYGGVYCVRGHVSFKINVYVKDGRYKYIIHSLDHEGSYYDGNRPISYGRLTDAINPPSPSRGGPSKKAWADIKGQSITQVNALIASLKSDMVKKSESQDDW